MSSRVSDAVLRRHVLSRPSRRRLRKPFARVTGARKAPAPRAARAPYIPLRPPRGATEPPLGRRAYLRISGRWLEEHGFTIGSGVQVLV
jgi:hypothetical protein